MNRLSNLSSTRLKSTARSRGNDAACFGSAPDYWIAEALGIDRTMSKSTSLRARLVA
jgi:hypothetical protein